MSTPTQRLKHAEAQWDLLFLGSCAVLVLVLVTKLQTRVLPDGLSSQIGHNSEVWALALVLGLGLVVLRSSTPRSKALALAVATGSAVLAGVVYWLDTPTTVKTMNEPLLAAGLLIVYCLLARPLPRSVPWLIALTTAVIILVWSQASLVFQQAESLTAVMVAPIAFDVMDRSVLEPGQRPSRLAPAWVGAVVLVPALALATGDFRTSDGILPETIDYLARGAEGFWGIAVLQGYFLLRRRLSPLDGIDSSTTGSPQDESFRLRWIPRVGTRDAG